jgi:predicted RNA-binding Zn ribbon-like protein
MKGALQVIARSFSPDDIVGGDAALDFINTVAGRDRSPRDWLDSYARLLEWAELVQLLPEPHLRSLKRKAHNDPTGASAALARAKELREALFALITGIVVGRAPPKSAFDLLREYWIRGISAHELHFVDGHIAPALDRNAVGFDLIASVVAYRMVEHVLRFPKDRLRICQGPDCSWLFIDRSKAGRRRWCDMAVCGNSAKSRRFYARSRKS